MSHVEWERAILRHLEELPDGFLLNGLAGTELGQEPTRHQMQTVGRAARNLAHKGLISLGSERVADKSGREQLLAFVRPKDAAAAVVKGMPHDDIITIDDFSNPSIAIRIAAARNPGDWAPTRGAGGTFINRYVSVPDWQYDWGDGIDHDDVDDEPEEEEG